MADLDAALRDLVRQRAAGFCEYCRTSERFTLVEHQIDHVIALKHGGTAAAENLALCCTLCNRFKGSDIASIDLKTGKLTPLFHPRLDSWEEHYEIFNGEIRGLTDKGRVTSSLLRMNRPPRIKERLLFLRR